MIINNDSLIALKKLDDNTIDAVITDPPYGYSFMGKDWDKAVPSVEIWKECLRVLKPGGWCMVMSAPRSDVQNAMTSRLMEAGFRLDFTPIYWTYSSGFPKAANISKLVDKRLGAEREKIPNPKAKQQTQAIGDTLYGDYSAATHITPVPVSDAAKSLDGSYAGFQPKPAVEVIIVAMKPLIENTYIDQALENRKGITWLDDCRIPTEDDTSGYQVQKLIEIYGKYGGGVKTGGRDGGRFPANLLVSDDVLNDHSKYFDLDGWADIHLAEQQIQTFPFAIFPKANKGEKNKGLDLLEAKRGGGMMANTGETMALGEASLKGKPKVIQASKNHHPTVKPLKLMSYLITLATREGDTVLDPFVGSGTTVVAAKQLNRRGIGIEREAEYAEIAQARLEAVGQK